MTRVLVKKLNEHGAFVWQYEGEIIAHGDTWVTLNARMGRDVPTDYVHFRMGDLMTEMFYADRWYNVFRIQDVDDGRLKGWYCNITRPASIDWSADPVTVSAQDLALDVFVSPQGAIRVLDEDEFAELDITDAERKAAWDAVDTIRLLAESRAAPFGEIA